MFDVLLRFFVIAMFSQAAFAGSFYVDPVKICINEEQQVGTLHLVNDSDVASVVHLSATKWWQDADEKLNEAPTTSLVLAPPTMSLKARETRVVRIMLRDFPKALENELAYRIHLEELPVTLHTKDLNQEKNGVLLKGGKQARGGFNFVLNISLPVFVEPVKKVSKIKWDIKKIDDKSLLVQLLNEGNIHIKASSISLYDEKGKSISHIDAADYVLCCGHSTKWMAKLSKPLTAKSVKIVAFSDLNDGEEVTADVVINSK